MYPLDFMRAFVKHDPDSAPLDFHYRSQVSDFSLIEAIPARKLKHKKRFIGGLLDNNKKEVALARLVRGPTGARQKIVSLEGMELTGQASPCPEAYGAFYFLGGFSWHYGHFLLEGLSRVPLSQTEKSGGLTWTVTLIARAIHLSPNRAPWGREVNGVARPGWNVQP